MPMDLRSKNARDQANPDDGERLLLCRHAPRGGSPGDQWERELAPSVKLDYALWRGWITSREHAALFVAELWAKAPRLRAIGERARRGRVTLLCPCQDAASCRGRLVVALVTRLFEARRPQLAAVSGRS